MATDLVTVPRDAMIIPLDTAQVSQAMTAYQEGLKSILADSDWQKFVSKGEEKRFLKRSGWRKIAFWFGLDLEVLSTEVERDSADNPLRARVIARATHPNGRRADGDGYCSAREPRVFGKPENDIPATAATRAMNRAISNLVGMGEVSAEEIDAGDINTTPEYGPTANSKEISGLERAVGALYDVELGDLAAALQGLVDRLENDAGGYLPRIVARALMLTAAHRPAPQADGPDVDDQPKNTPGSDERNTDREDSTEE